MKEKLKLIIKKKRVIVPAVALIVVGISNALGHPINEHSLEAFLNSFLDLFSNL